MPSTLQIISEDLRTQFLTARDIAAFEWVLDPKKEAFTHLGILREESGVVSGVVELCIDDTENKIILVDTEVLKTFRGEGRGANMMRGIFDHAHTMAQNAGAHAHVITDGFGPEGEAALMPVLSDLSDSSEHVTHIDVPMF